MDYNCPLLLVAKYEYLESFQNGNFFMKNSFYYQELYDKDLQRGDKYDSAIKCGYDEFEIPQEVKECTKYPRILSGDSFIKCFFEYSLYDAKLLPNKQIAYHIPLKSQEALLSFDEEYALLVDKQEMINLFIKACEKENYKGYYGNVEYIEDADYERIILSIKDSFKNKTYDSVKHPTLIKNVKYKAQQEFRFCVSKKLTVKSIENTSLNKVSYKDSIILKIDGLNKISTIVKLKDIIDTPIIYDIEKDELFIYCSE